MEGDVLEPVQLAEWASQYQEIKDYHAVVMNLSKSEGNPYYGNILMLLSWGDLPSFLEDVELLVSAGQASKEESSIEFYARWSKGFMHQLSRIAHLLTMAGEATLHDRLPQVDRLKGAERLDKAVATVVSHLKILELNALVKVESSNSDESRSVPCDLFESSGLLSNLLNALASKGQSMAATPGYLKNVNETNTEVRFTRKLDLAMSAQLNKSVHKLVAVLTNMYFLTDYWDAKKVANTCDAYSRSLDSNRALREHMSRLNEVCNNMIPKKLNSIWKPVSQK